MTEENPTPPTTDLDILPDPKSPGWIPSGSSIVHQDINSGAIWKLCCRIRLDMKEEGSDIKDALELLWMAHPHLEFTENTFQHFLEEFVDPFIVVEPTFFKKGLMRARARLNAAVEISEVAQRMQDKWESVEEFVGEKEGVPLKDWMAAGKKVVEARRIQAAELARVGFGPKAEPEDKGKQPIILPTQHNITVNLGESLGGSFRRAPIDVKPKQTDGKPT